MRNQNQILPRRSFLKHGSAFALALPLVEVSTLSLLGCGPASSAEQKAMAPRAENLPAKVVIVADKEPGEPLIVSGVIVAPDGRTPLEGIKLYVYQTDATGVYSTAGGGGDNRNHAFTASCAQAKTAVTNFARSNLPLILTPASLRTFMLTFPAPITLNIGSTSITLQTIL